MRFAVLGSGPAGLIAAHALRLHNHDTLIFAKGEKSPLYGAQYLHAPIPGITDHSDPNLNDGLLPPEPVTVRYQLWGGTPEDYRRKVYGPAWDGNVSPEDLEVEHQAWDIRSAYDALWNKYCTGNDTLLRYANFNSKRSQTALNELEGLCDFFGIDIVISTIPRPIFGHPFEIFDSSSVYAIGDMDDRRVGTFVPENTIVCDATEDTAWYRASNVFGYHTVEYPAHDDAKKPPLEGIRLVTKPLARKLKDNAPEDWIHPIQNIRPTSFLGRFGAWRKGVLVSDVWKQANFVAESYEGFKEGVAQ